MAEPLKLMCILAHPDDESLGTGGILARYADEGIETFLIVATRGQRGWTGNPEHYPGLEKLGKIREEELRCSSKVLGVKELILLDFVDGEVDKIEPQTIVPQIVQHLRRVRPDVVVTFDPYGVYGHPDHIAISQFTLAAIVSAANASLGGDTSLPPHSVLKLYFIAETAAKLDSFQAVIGNIQMEVDGEERQAIAWPAWAVSAEVNITPYWEKVVQSVRCHGSQVKNPDEFASMSKRFEPAAWAFATFYRAFSLVNTGRAKEKDLFEGLRPQGIHVEIGT